jgi:SWI/SNF-related matrix-associated actin-dependent regulator of chromatin subfamily A3
MARGKRPIPAVEVIDLTADSPPSSKASKTNQQAAAWPSSSASYSTRLDDHLDDDFVEDGVDVDASQSFNSLTDHCLYGTLSTKIVGCRYYNGYVTTGEMVMVRREPQNPYDRNAIQVLNVRSEQIGHISRAIALKLAPFMDRKTLVVEAQTTGPKDYFDCPLSLKFYGTTDIVARNSIKEEMKAARLPTDGLTQMDKAAREEEKRKKEQEKLLKKAKKSGVIIANEGNGGMDFSSSQWAGSSGASLGPNMEDIMRESERFNPRNVEEMVEKFGDSEENLKNMPMAEQPKSIKSQLLNHQRQALQWMLEKENPQLPPPGSTESVQLWKRTNNGAQMFTNIATNFSINTLPTLASGGILADDMGLGKTLQTISLILADKEIGLCQNIDVSSATLIVAPLSVMSNWTQQIEKHVREDYPVRVMVYHGARKQPLNPSSIKDFDVVVTTYDTVRSEYWSKKKQASTGIASVKWRRIVLDEGHTVRNPASKTATAICDLKAHSRWVLTGTPIVNSLKDLFSLVLFLKLSGGLDRFELFNGAIIRPLNAGYESAAKILQALMNSICLRRKKEMKFIDLKLSELSEFIHRIDFAPHEKKMYDALEAQATGTLEEYQKKQGKAGSDASKAYRHLLETLLRLRQICNHSQLVGEDRLKALEGIDGIVDLTSENKEILLKMLNLSIESQEDCPICIDTLADPVITLCTHTFCFACIEKVIDGQHKCPMCRAPLDDFTKLLRPATEVEPSDSFEIRESSSKVEALLSILKASHATPGNKTIIFSQWTRFLDVISIQLQKHNYRFVRIDGTMSATARDSSMASLESDPKVTILLASLGACSVGLNLVAANQVILADSWWAPAIEDQAVDRVHRLGQTRETTVFRLVMAGSIEENVLAIQQRKRKLMMLAFAEKKAKRGNERGAALADIQALLRSSAHTA